MIHHMLVIENKRFHWDRYSVRVIVEQLLLDVPSLNLVVTCLANCSSR